MEGQQLNRADVVSPQMLGDLIWCYADESAAKAAELMEQKQIHRLPVLDRQMHLCGILSRRDVEPRRDLTSADLLRRAGKMN